MGWISEMTSRRRNTKEMQWKAWCREGSWLYSPFSSSCFSLFWKVLCFVRFETFGTYTTKGVPRCCCYCCYC